MAFNIHEEIRSNQIKSVFIIGIFFLFIATLGAVVGSIISINYTAQLFHLQSILISVGVAVVISIIYVLIFMASGSKMILSATGAKPASRKHYPHLFHTTEALSIAAGLSTPPQCYVIDDPALNAYATGFKPEKSFVVVTTGLIKKLNREELEGVIAHEIAHIKNQDIKIMLLAAGLVGVTVFLADFLFRMFIFGSLNNGGGKKDGRLMIFMFVFYFILIVTAPIVAQLIKLAISRRREYLADATGAQLTRYPEGLASALEKIKNDSHADLKSANKATAHLFISMPFSKKRRGFLNKMFSTHPPIEKRIAILRGTQK